ncbi:hypothetical protein HPB48_007614 [Haemaphysalis longicornis]|uniref:Ricin B lectin domain-containing protein n=1 Tax=Haemaphysalis longicornis TaxID=44386 RepID=A0A9J6G3X5_HAELO|nr:hypothetical protein HPB48_007614 [Haemaphysalis longicornis]
MQRKYLRTIVCWNALEPIVDLIRQNRSTIVCPVINWIEGKTLEFKGSEEDIFRVGGFTWDGYFTFLDTPVEWRKARKSPTEPVRVPTMAGGLFAVNREYFFEIGAYDDAMEGWGGENLEISFRTWMCGGSIVQAPCSYVGHVFRSSHPFKFPSDKDTFRINTARLAEVWMDSYKEVFYFMNPGMKNVSYGDVSERKALRKRLKCKSFKWYLDNVYPKVFIPTERVFAYGYVKNPATDMCIDSMQHDLENLGESLGVYPCHPENKVELSQFTSYSWASEIRKEDMCAELGPQSTVDGKVQAKVVMWPCGANLVSLEHQRWDHTRGGPIRHRVSGLCLESNITEQDAMLAVPCTGTENQMWRFQHYIEAQPQDSTASNQS